jgi:hypothetical protein
MNRFSPTDDEFIIAHCDPFKDNYLTDAEIGKQLNRTPIVVAGRRRKLGFKKDSSGRKTPGELATKITRQEKKKLIIKTFKSSPRYKQLQKILNEEEIGFFAAQWESLINEVDEVNSKEVENVYLMILEAIKQQRLLEMQNKATSESDKLMIVREYGESVKLYLKLQESLAWTRAGRLKDGSRSGVSILDIVESILTDKTKLDDFNEESRRRNIENEQFLKEKLGSSESEIIGLEDKLEEEK